MSWYEQDFVRTNRSQKRGREFRCAECRGWFTAPTFLAYHLKLNPFCPLCLEPEERGQRLSDQFNALFGGDDDAE